MYGFFLFAHSRLGRFFLILAVLTLFPGGASVAFAQEDADFAPPDEDAPALISSEELEEMGLLPLPVPSARRSMAPDSRAVGGAWSPQGAGPARNGQVEGSTIIDLEVVGAIHTVIAHPTNSDILWLGGANGGIWKTTNAQTASPIWVPQTDTQSSLSIGAMDLDPTDGSHNTLVAGIGRYSSFARRGASLDGVLRTTDGGTTWTPITDPLLDGESCSGIAARGGTIVFASGESFGFGGLYRSTDTGATWTKIDGAGGTGLPADDVHDLVCDPNTNARLYLTMDDKGVYRSDNTGATWTLISDASQVAVFAAGGNNNAELAVSPSGRVYVAIILNGQAQSIEYTDNPTAATPTWVAMDLPTTPTGGGATIIGATNASPIVITTAAAHGFTSGSFVEITGVTGNTAANGIFRISSLSTTTFSLNLSTGNGVYAGGGSATKTNGLNPGEKPGSQGGTHFSIVADPVDANTVYVGGDRQDLDSFPNFLGAFNFSGRLWRGDTGVAPTGASPSPQWEHLTHSDSVVAIPGGGTASNSSPHADSREMVFDADGNIVETDDGGIYLRTSPGDNSGDWYSLNGTAQVAEQHDIAYDTVSNIIISGNQDTGTTQQQALNNFTWDSVSTADGGDVAVDPSSVAPNSIRYSSFQNLGSFRRRTYNSSNVLVASVLPALTGKGAWSPKFVTPVEVNAVSPARIVLGGTNGILESLDRGDNVTLLATSSINDDCLAYGANGMAEVLYAASGSTVLVRLSGAGAPTATAAAFPGGTVTDLAIDPSDHLTLFATDSDSVFVTDDAGASWTDITGNLLDSTLQAIEFIDGGVKAIAVGGLSGVSVMDVTDPGVWDQLGTGLPNMLVYDLDYDPVDDVLVAGTLGRGAWLLEDAGAPADMLVTVGGFVSTGDQGGPFTPTCKTYTIENTTGTPFNWTASTDGWWLSLNVASGTLAAFSQVSVDACVNSLAVFAASGNQQATITFTNTTSAEVALRDATLSVTNALLHSFPLSTDPGWSETGDWAFGVPQGNGSNNPDPTSGHTGSNVYGYNLAGDYPNTMSEETLTTTAIDCTGFSNTQLSFWRWLGVESATFDHAKVQVSNNGSTWTDVWVHTQTSAIAETSWSQQTYDIGSIADGKSTVFLRWVMGATDGSVTFSGWNIDDVLVESGGVTMRAEVWVDFAYAGTETGTESQPYNTFEEARQAVIPGGAIKMKGDTADNSSSETTTIQRPVTITAVNGPVSIGQP